MFLDFQSKGKPIAFGLSKECKHSIFPDFQSKSRAIAFGFHEKTKKHQYFPIVSKKVRLQPLDFMNTENTH